MMRLPVLERLVARQAVLNRLLKVTVYEWHHRRGELPEFPADTWEIIQSVAEVGANPGFGECVLDYFLLHVDESEMEVIDENRDRLLASTQPAEDIGRLYEAVIPKEYRQSLSQFRTPPDIGQLMRLWAGESDNTVVDPGMGAGVLSSPFHPDWRLSTDSARVIGIDQSQLALLMGSTALTLYGQPHELLETDFFNIPSSDLQQDLDALVCNPPYTEGDALPDWYKERINTQLEKTTGLEISARSPLHAYFIYHSHAFLSPSDRAAFITPQSFLSNRYGESLKQFLLDNYAIKAFVQFNPESYCVFDNADTTALLTFLEAKPDSETGGETRFIRVDEKIESKTIRDAVENGEPGKLSGESSTVSHNPNFALRRTGRPCSTLSRSIRVTSRLLGHSSPSTAGQQQAKSISSACHSRKSMRTISTNATCRGSSVSRVR